jgi:fused signal recognition particle receptor
MFGKLKEKLKSWTQKISSKTEETSEEKEELTEEQLEDEEKIEIPEEIKKDLEEKDKKRKQKKNKKFLEPITEKEITEEETPKTKEPKLEKTQEEKPVEKKQEEPGKESFFKKAVSKINKVKISEKEFEIYEDELEMLLLENNVALEVAEKIIQELKTRVIGQEFLKKEIETEIQDYFKEVINEILVDPFKLTEKIKIKQIATKDEPYVILFCGINGTGKTTSIAKISERLKQAGISSVLAAADTFRAAAIDQLKKHGEKLNIPVIAQDYGVDPASVAFDAVAYAKKNKIACVLIDTAGRMHTSKNLMAQIEKISKVAKPDLKIYVGESTTGNDAIEQIKSFNFSIGIDGIILSKADIDEKGGTALSVGYVTKKPILFLGTGQEYHEIEAFDKQKFIERLGL